MSHNVKKSEIECSASTSKSKRSILHDEKGAIDLASIMVGITVIGLIGGVIAATVFAVIPWVQDNMAKQQLDSIASAESAYLGLSSSVPSGLPEGYIANTYAVSDQLESAGLLRTDEKSYCVTISANGKDYQAIAKSSSSNLFSISSATTKPTPFTGTLPEDCSFLSSGDASNPAEPKDTITTLTYLCEPNADGTVIARTGTVPMQENLNGTLNIKSGSLNEERDYSDAKDSGAITMQSGVTYTITLDGTYTKFSNASNALAPCLRSLDHWGNDTGVIDAANGLALAANLVSVPAEIPSTVISLAAFFQNAANIDDPNISKWDVSNVTTMEFMFEGAAIFNQPLDKWNTSKVGNMRLMFKSATLFNKPLNDWDVSKVTNMYNMFNAATRFNQPLDKWDVSNVIHMHNMFTKATNFNQPLNDWDVSSVTNMYGMFWEASNFNQPLDKWNVSKVANMSRMFIDAPKFSQNLSTWKTASLKDGQYFTNSPLMTKSYLPSGTTT